VAFQSSVGSRLRCRGAIGEDNGGLGKEVYRGILAQICRVESGQSTILANVLDFCPNCLQSGLALEKNCLVLSSL